MKTEAQERQKMVPGKDLNYNVTFQRKNRDIFIRVFERMSHT